MGFLSPPDRTCWTCYTTSKNLWGKWQAKITLNLIECAGLWETGSCNELGAGEVEGTVLSPSALCDTVRVWGCTTGKHLDQFRACVPFVLPLCAHVSWSAAPCPGGVGLGHSCTSHSRVCDGALQRSPLRAAVQPPVPWDCLRTQLCFGMGHMLYWHSAVGLTWPCGRFEGVVWWRWTVHSQRYKPA